MTAPNRLDLGNSPPLDLPLRFLLLAPLFGAAAGLLMAWRPEALLAHRLTGTALAFNHLLTLGFMGLIQIGALTQLLPVLAGASLPAARMVRWLGLPLWCLGTATLAAGFHVGDSRLLELAGAFLLPALVGIPVPLTIALYRAVARSPSVQAMQIAIAALLVTLVLGLVSLMQRSGLVPDIGLGLELIHPTVGLLGWTLILVAGVAYQVVPMFQITPAYPIAFARLWAPWMALSLLVLAAALIAGPGGLWLWLPALGLAIGTAIFASLTLDRQMRRKRRRADVTHLYWRLAMLCLLFSTLIWGARRLLPDGRADLVAGLMFLLGFAVPVINGMTLKIVPFLIWLHLKNRQTALSLVRVHRIPLMDDIIPAAQQRWQWWVYMAMLVLLGLGLLEVALWKTYSLGKLAGLTLAVDMMLLESLILSAWRRFGREESVMEALASRA
ncbi:MAG: hypothetical protein ACPG4N_05175 [Gammaproteobacteria bacterium]